MRDKISRRDFINKSVLGIGLAGINAIKCEKKINNDDLKGISGELPKRTLGKTGRMVSCIGFGGGSRYWKYVSDEGMAEKLIDSAVKLGVTYFDTAISYGDGKTEKRYGKYLTPKYRNQIFLVSKTKRRKYDEVMQDIETTLKNLNTDHLDLYHMHSIDTIEEVNTLSSSSGGYKAYTKLKNEGVIKNIGFSFHKWNEASRAALEKFDLDVVMCVLNASRNSGSEENFLPIAIGKNIGIVAMKITAARVLIGNVTAPDLVRYSVNLPIAVANIGMDGFTTLESCVEIGKQPVISENEREKIHIELAFDPAKTKLPYFH